MTISHHYYKVCVIRELDCGVRQSLQFTMTVISDSTEHAEEIVRRQLCEQYFDWQHFVWEIDFYSWARIRECENEWARKLVRMKSVEGVFA